MSELESLFALHLRANKIDHLFEREYSFHPSRKWRFDFACIEYKIAIELQGGIFGRKSGHNTGTAIIRNMDKMNEAQRLGWRVFQFHGDEIRAGEAVRYMNIVLLDEAVKRQKEQGESSYVGDIVLPCMQTAQKKKQSKTCAVF